MDRRLAFIAAAFLIAISYLLLREAFATAWSNKCDPGNAQFFLLKNDPSVGFKPDGTLFVWQHSSPDNSWLCSEADFSVSYIGPQIASMFEAARANMTANGWVGGEIFLKDQDFAVYEKEEAGVRLNAIVRKQPFWVQVDMNAPGFHLGENGFG